MIICNTCFFVVNISRKNALMKIFLFFPSERVILRAGFLISGSSQKYCLSDKIITYLLDNYLRLSRRKKTGSKGFPKLFSSELYS